MDARGYFNCSLLYNLAWGCGLTKLFESVRLDYEIQERTITSNGNWYGQVIVSNIVVE
jgi:beta-glucosidase/6-phospho-beta-glucosidase/beta-galactosidase